MRLWSLSPEYLDRQGLLAVWREGLLARQVLAGKTRGYKQHPQLLRFKETKRPLAYINAYLSYIYQEALARGYAFSRNKTKGTKLKKTLPVSREQLAYEFRHLRRKLKSRSPHKFRELSAVKHIKPHPLFRVVSGPIAPWEKIK